MTKEPRPHFFTAIIDTREQRPWDLEMPHVRGKLDAGDYSIKGCEGFLAIERKSLADLVMCVGRERERFDRECQKLLGYAHRAIIVEASMADLELGAWRGLTTTKSVLGSVAGWMAMGIPILLAGNAHTAGQMASRMLWIAAKRRYQEAYELMGGKDGGRQADGLPQ